MKVLIVSGIWPPDVGGPASHAPELAGFLRSRGHAVEVVVTADRAPAAEAYPVRHVSRRLPPGVRHIAVAFLVARRARENDVVYATSMLARSALGALIARRPLVVKVTTDAAFERARREGLVAGDVAQFQAGATGLRVRVYRALRDFSLGRARAVVCPSAYLSRIILGWGVEPDRVSVLPNPVATPLPPTADERAALREALGFVGPTVVAAGRLTTAKAIDVALDAVAQLDNVTLVVVGDGADRASLEECAAQLGLGGRVRFTGALPRERVLELFAAADVMVLSSRWENFPHTVIEALGVGTPVVATRVGGVPEIVSDGGNGLLVEPGDAVGLAATLARVLDDGELRARLAAAAASSVATLRPEQVYSRLERILAKAA